MKALSSYFKKKMFFFQIFLYVIFSIIGIVTPYYEGYLINTIVGGDSLNIYIILCFVGLLIFGFRVLNSYFLSKVQYFYVPKLQIELNQKIISQLLEKDAYKLLLYDGSYLNNRIRGDIASVTEFLYLTIPYFISNIITMLSISIIILTLNPFVFIYFLGILVIYIILYIFNSRKMYDVEYWVREVGDKYYATNNSLYSRLINIKTQMIKYFELLRLQTKTNDLLQVMNKNFLLKYLISTLKIIVVFVSQFIFFIVGGLSVIKKEMSIGIFTAVLQYFGLFINCLDGFFSFGMEIQSYGVAKMRLIELLEMPSDENGTIEINNLETISIQNFNTYYEFDKYLYNNLLNCEFSKNKLYLLNGKNGAGKTTLLLNLLGVFKNQYTGNILINGDSIKNINMDKFRLEKVAYMFQDNYWDNILVCDYISKYQELDAVLKILEDDGFMPVFQNSIFDLNNYLDKNLAELSGGERRLIDLFVTLSKPNSELVILDEPLVNIAVDLKLEVMNLIKRVSLSKMVIMITHDNLDVSCENCILID